MTEEATTAAEVRDGLADLCREIGAKAAAYVQLSNSYSLCATIHPDGILGNVRIQSRDLADWGDVIPALREAWAEHEALHASNTIKAMAIAIIRLTAELGECTDSALRVEFDQTQIDRHGDAAAELATEMGANGPFSIVRLGAGNMPEAA